MFPEISARWSLLEPSFRYLSPGREGEKCRALDHLRQIPFIHSDRFWVVIVSVYIQNCTSYFFHVVGTSGHNACALAETLTSVFRSIIKLLSCFFYGTCGCVLIQNTWHLLNKRNRPLSRAVWLNFCFVLYTSMFLIFAKRSKTEWKT